MSRLPLLIRVVLASLLGCMVFPVLAVAAPTDTDPLKLAPGDQWSIGKTDHDAVKSGKVGRGVKPAASGWSWVCRGTFAAPDLSTVGGFSWGAYQQCSSPLDQQVSVKVNLCVQDPGGPSHFHCDVYKGGRKGDLVLDTYQVRTNATVSTCSRSKTSKYVQVAYSIMADYEYYPRPVESNQVSIKCGY